MALWDVRVEQAKVDVEYVDEPVLSPSSLGVIVSKQVGQYNHTSSVYGTNPIPAGEESSYILVPELPNISGASMPVGSRWLVWCGASLGSGTSTGVVECYLVSGHTGTIKNLKHGLAKCTGHGTPQSMNGSFMGEWFEYVSDGSALRFAIRNVQGSGVNPLGVFIQGAILIGIPMDNNFTFGSGMDWNAVRGSLVEATPDLTTTTSSFQTVLSMPYTAPANGEYLILAGTEVKFNVGELANARVKVNGITRLGTWQKKSQDNRDVHSFCYGEIVSLNSGSNTITIEGNSFLGANAKNFFRSSIVILRLARFGSYVQATYPNPSQMSVSVTHPSWETEVAATYTPYVAGEYALVIASGQMFRGTSQSSMLMRTYNATEIHSVHDFTSTAHPTTNSNEKPVLMSCGAELVNAPNAYQVQITGEPGYSSSPVQDFVQWPVNLIVLGLTPVAAPNPQIISIDGNETVGVSENSTSPVSGHVIDETDPVTVGETGSVDSLAPTSVPVNHPRAWFNDNGAREAYLIAQKNASSAAWTNITSGALGTPWVRCLYWLMTQSSSDLSVLAGQIDAETSLPLNGSTGIITGSGDSNGLYWYDHMESLAYCYDWLMWKGVLNSDFSWLARKKRMEDMMMASCYQVFNPSSTLLGATTVSGWAINDPLNNYHYRKMGGAVLVAMALYHEWDTKGGVFSWPPGSATSYQWSARVISGGGSGILYTDIREWVVDKLEAQALPSMAQYGLGGGWHEGSNYGRAAIRHSCEWLSVMKQAGWKQYIDQYPIWKSGILYELYAQQPGNTNLIHYSTAPSQFFALGVNDYDRHLIMLAVEAFQGTAESQYGQWWLDNQSSLMGSTTPSMRGWEFLLYRDRGKTDYRNVLPNHYHASGVGMVNSRNNWFSTADSVSVNSGALPDVAEHWDEDLLGVQIWSGGWIMVDQRYLTSDSGAYNGEDTMAAANWHSGYVLANLPVCARGGGGSTTLPAGSIARNFGNTVYSYAQAEANDAYYTKSSASHFAHAITKISDVAMRETVHIKALGVVVIYDRVRMLPAYASGPARGYYQWRTQPVAVGPLHYIQYGSRRVWRKFMDTLASSVVEASVNGWRDNFTLALSSGYGEQRTVLEITDSAVANMTPTAVVNSTAMKGASIYASTYYHVIFSSSQNGSMPYTSVAYDVVKNGSNDKHIVCNMKPNVGYLVSETNLGGGIYRYQLDETGVQGIAANTAGVVEFTPADLAAQGAKLISGTDTVEGFVETGTLDYGAIITSDLEAVGVAEEGEVLSSAGNIISIDGFETVGVVETDNWTTVLDAVDSVSVVEDGTLDHIAPPPRPTFYTEKVISSFNPDLIPNETSSSAFMYAEPQTASFHDVLADEDDNTFLRISYPGIAFCSVMVGLTNLSGYVGTIRAIQFHVRFRKINAIGLDTPMVRMTLYSEDFSLIKMVVFPASFVDENSPTTFNSALITVTVPRSISDMMILKTELRANSYTGYANFEEIAQLSRTWISVVGDLTEKIIS